MNESILKHKDKSKAKLRKEQSKSQKDLPVQTPPNAGSQESSATMRRLTLTVKEATKFTAPDAASKSHYIEVFCNEKSLGSTAPVSGANPVWNHTFTIDDAEESFCVMCEVKQSPSGNACASLELPITKFGLQERPEKPMRNAERQIYCSLTTQTLFEEVTKPPETPQKTNDTLSPDSKKSTSAQALGSSGKKQDDKAKTSRSSENIANGGKQKRLSLSFMKREKSGNDLAERLQEEAEKDKTEKSKESKEKSKKEDSKEKDAKLTPHKLTHSTANLVGMTFPSHKHKDKEEKSEGEKSKDGGSSSKKKDKKAKGEKPAEQLEKPEADKKGRRLSMSLTHLKDFATGEKSEEKKSKDGGKKKLEREKSGKRERGEDAHSGGAGVQSVSSVEDLSERSREDGDRSVEGKERDGHAPTALLHQLSPRSKRDKSKRDSKLSIKISSSHSSDVHEPQSNSARDHHVTISESPRPPVTLTPLNLALTQSDTPSPAPVPSPHPQQVTLTVVPDSETQAQSRSENKTSPDSTSSNTSSGNASAQSKSPMPAKRESDAQNEAKADNEVSNEKDEPAKKEKPEKEKGEKKGLLSSLGTKVHHVMQFDHEEEKKEKERLFLEQKRKQERERAEAERLEMERVKLEKEKAEQQRIQDEKIESERRERFERAEKERIEKERAEMLRIEAETRLESEKKVRERIEREERLRKEKEEAEKARVEKARREKEDEERRQEEERQAALEKQRQARLERERAEQQAALEQQAAQQHHASHKPNPTTTTATHVVQPTNSNGSLDKIEIVEIETDESPNPIVSPEKQSRFLASSRVTHRDADYMYKVIVVGNSGVGKTCVLKRWVSDEFSETTSTISAALFAVSYDVEGSCVTFNIWDTAGQERFRSLTNAYYRGAHGIIVVYDVTNLDSFESVESWLDDIELYSDNSHKLLLLANKSDAVNERCVPTEKGRKLATDKHMYFMEASARTGNQVQDAIQILLNEIHTPELLEVTQSTPQPEIRKGAVLPKSTAKQASSTGTGSGQRASNHIEIKPEATTNSGAAETECQC